MPWIHRRCSKVSIFLDIICVTLTDTFRATSTKTNSKPITVAAGQVYDGGWARFDRGSGACSSGEGGSDDAVFILKAGATLRNVIIGKNQKEGVHCDGQ